MDPFYIAPDVEDQILANVKNLRRQQASIAASVTEEAARRAIALTRAVPNASGGLVGAAAMEGTPPELVAELAQQDDGGFSFGGLIGNVADFVGDRFQDGYEQIIKPVVRSAFTLSEGLAQEVVQRPLTAALTAFTDDNATGFQDAYNQYGDSPLLNIAQGEVNPFDEGAMGEGFFTGGAAQQQSMADRTLTIDGKMASLGRALPTTQLAGEVFGNDSFAYNLAAGVGQFAFDVVADPLAGGLGVAGKVAKAAKGIDASQAAKAMKLLPDPSASLIGDVGEAAKGTPLRREVHSWVMASDDSRVREAWAGLTDDEGAVEFARNILAGPRHDRLVRGMDLTDDSPILNAAVGDSFELPPSSFAKSVNERNKHFFEREYANVVIEAKGARGADMDALIPDWSFQQEVVSGGAFRVTGRSVDEGGITRLTVEQVDPYGGSEFKAGMFGAVQGGGRASALLEEMVPKLANREVLSALAAADANTIWKSVKSSAANQFDADILRRLGAAADEDEVATILLDAAQQKKVTETGFYSGLRGTRRKVRDLKIAGTAARGRIHQDDLVGAADALDTWMRQAKIGEEYRAATVNSLFDVGALPAAERGDAFVDVVKKAVATGSGNMADELDAIEGFFTSFKAEKEFAREFGIDLAGDIITSPTNKVDEVTGAVKPTVQMIAELADDGMVLPDVTAVRRAAQRSTRMNKLYASKGWEGGADIARFMTRDIFKPLAILRPAYVLRIGLEEQFRLAAMGYDSLVTHPARFIKANIVARSTDEALGYKPTSVNGKEMLDEGSVTAGLLAKDAEAMGVINRRAYSAQVGDGPDRNFLLSGNWSQYDKPAEFTQEFGKHWRHELDQLAASPEARWFAANGYDLDGFTDWARNSAEGRRVVERIDVATKGRGKLIQSDDNLREWGHSIAVRIASKSGGDVVKEGDNWIVRSLGDDDLMEAMTTGGFAKFNLANKFDLAPAKVKFPTRHASGKEQGRLDAFVNGLFETLTAKPTNSLARYPAFRQAYIKYAQQSMDALASNDLRREFFERMDDALTLTNKERKTFAKALTSNTGKTGYFDDLGDMDEVIKLRAAQETKDLLFDATKRSNFQEAYEVGVPFFDAWAEVTTTWARLLKENPGFFIKAMQGLDSARQSGVIYANDFGEEVFAYPGGGMLSKFFPGEDSVKFEGRLQGANLVAQGVGPGFGPVVQWGVGAFLPKTRELQALREWLAPFGTGGIESAGDISDPSAVLDSVIPAWARKFSNAVTGGKIDEVQWNSTMGDVAKVLANSGAYDPTNPDDQQRLLNDAQRGAKTILLMRSLTQGVGITGASATWQVKTDGDEGEAIPTDWSPEADPDGTWHSIGILANEYRRLRDFYNYDDDIAASVFLDMYGVEPFYISQAKTRSISELPVDEQGDFWIREHAEVAETYPAIIGYFVPPDEDAPLDYAIYRDQITRGDRQSLTAKQQIQLANQVKARAFRDNIKERVSALPSSARSDVMAQVNAYLEDEYPGWQNPVLGVDAKLRSSQKIDQLQLAVNDERLADSPVTGPLRDYLKVRDGVLAIAQQRGLKTLTSDKVSDLREALMEYGLQLKQSNPEFAGVWTRLLASEVRE